MRSEVVHAILGEAPQDWNDFCKFVDSKPPKRLNGENRAETVRLNWDPHSRDILFTTAVSSADDIHPVISVPAINVAARLRDDAVIHELLTLCNSEQHFQALQREISDNSEGVATMLKSPLLDLEAHHLGFLVTSAVRDGSRKCLAYLVEHANDKGALDELCAHDTYDHAVRHLTVLEHSLHLSISKPWAVHTLLTPPTSNRLTWKQKKRMLYFLLETDEEGSCHSAFLRVYPELCRELDMPKESLHESDTSRSEFTRRRALYRLWFEPL